ncbi:related to Peroxisomal 2,4-dienoyl-CoA reductase SPS19 [Phialocephala subalpina]|uniref:2,4-dienoyl-CoA reductase [(3E)-enoyl-CoA-producing] n=1 Tax=Phialocephala subalpina TaxID=576137 RepID=A0A1L7XKI0_9HELO|nr:related to Peroxisomal 2,4-dienoyl-CoA reductase SPS19 [Phialocephala subalpina]
MDEPGRLFSSGTWAPNLFAGKVVFCTGGAGTICSAQVKALVILGANAAIIGRRSAIATAAAKEIQSLRPGSLVVGISGDVRSVDSMKVAVARTVKELGRIDFLICGAAGNFLSPFDNLSANAFKTVIDIDLLGSFNATKACADELKRSRGRIIYISATLHYAGAALQTHAVAAKAGVDALSSQMCIEYGPIGVTSNVIAPGGIARTEGLTRLNDKSTWTKSQKMIPLQRWGTVSEIADATIFLFSPAAKYISGAIVPVDGGAWHMQSVVTSGTEYPENVLGDGINRVEEAASKL